MRSRALFPSVLHSSSRLEDFADFFSIDTYRGKISFTDLTPLYLPIEHNTMYLQPHAIPLWQAFNRLRLKQKTEIASDY